MKAKAERQRIESVVRQVLKRNKNILVAYMYGSFAKGKKRPGDIDIGVLLKDVSILEKRPYFESDLALKIEDKLRIKTPLDVRVLNKSGLRFVNQVLRYGKLIFSRNERERVNFETKAISNYFDFRPFLHEYEKIRAHRFGV